MNRITYDGIHVRLPQYDGGSTLIGLLPIGVPPCSLALQAGGEYRPMLVVKLARSGTFKRYILNVNNVTSAIRLNPDRKIRETNPRR